MNSGMMIILTIVLLAVIGLVIGILLVFAGEKFKVEVDQREIDVRACLPGNNCGACGYAGCDAVAGAIARGEAPVNACPVGGSAVADKISEIMGVGADGEAEKMVAFVKCAGTCDKAKKKGTYVGIKTCEAVAATPGRGDKACAQGCFGYGTCVAACQFDAIHIVDGIAKVDRTKCVACGKCAAACPQHLIEIIPDKQIYAVACASQEKGKATKAQCAAGCIGCKACTLVCDNNSIKVEDNIAHINYATCVQCGKCASKCPAKVIITRREAETA